VAERMAVLRAPRAGGRAVYEHVIDPSGENSFIRTKGLRLLWPGDPKR